MALSPPGQAKTRCRPLGPQCPATAACVRRGRGLAAVGREPSSSKPGCQCERAGPGAEGLRPALLPDLGVGGGLRLPTLGPGPPPRPVEPRPFEAEEGPQHVEAAADSRVPQRSPPTQASGFRPPHVRSSAVRSRASGPTGRDASALVDLISLFPTRRRCGACRTAPRTGLGVAARVPASWQETARSPLRGEGARPFAGTCGPFLPQ